MEIFDFTVSDVTLALRKAYNPKQSLVVQGRRYNGLTMVLSGKLLLTYPDGSTLTAKENDVILQRRGDFYRLETISEDKAEYIVISYLAEPENALFSLLPETRIFTPSQSSRFKDAFSRVNSADKSFGVCKKTLLKALVQEIICNIIGELYPDAPENQVSPTENAKFYIEEFYDREIKIAALASVTGFSVSHFRMLFKQDYGQSPLQYLNTVRINHAKEMLESGLFSLQEVADSCGFQNVYYFSKVFKSLTGIPPGKYGKDNRKI